MPFSTIARITTIGVIAVIALVTGKCPRPNKIDETIIAIHTPVTVGNPSLVLFILKVAQTSKVIKHNRNKISSDMPP